MPTIDPTHGGSHFDPDERDALEAPESTRRSAQNWHLGPDVAHEIYAKAKPVVEALGISVVEAEMPEGSMGFVDGESVGIDTRLEPERQLYHLIHFAAHSVHWAIEPGDRRFALPTVGALEGEEMDRYVAYEKTVGEYAATILIQAGGRDHLEWLSRFARADLDNFIAICRYPDIEFRFESFLIENPPEVAPRAIPEGLQAIRLGHTVNIIPSA
ncbi:MAG: hypothetical protein KDD53_04545 [Bdellovibrionales bacterium]|nr:hypothetical protein [Bdellovibrionales bacterium]